MVVKKDLSTYYKLFALFFSVVYAATLSSLPDQNFSDYLNYLIYAESSQSIFLNHLSQGLMPVLANEPVWLAINVLLSFFMQPDAVVRTIIFVSAFSVALLILLGRPQDFWWLLLFLLLPAVVKNFLIHIRQGFAIAVFIFAWFVRSTPKKVFWMAITPFIHASFFIILFIWGVVFVMLKLRLGPGVRIWMVSGMGALSAIWLVWFAAFLGARQAQEYQFVMTDVSGFGFLAWSVVLMAYILQGQDFLRRNAFAAGILAFYLGSYWFIEVAARIFESGLLLVLLAGLCLSSYRLGAFKFMVFFVFFVTGWVLRLNEPLLGFGVFE